MSPKKNNPENKKSGSSRQKATRSNTDQGQTESKGGNTSNLEDLTRDELYEKARENNIDGRSKMNKTQLIEAIKKGK